LENETRMLNRTDLSAFIVTSAVVFTSCGERDPALEWVGLYSYAGNRLGICNAEPIESNSIFGTLEITAIASGKLHLTYVDDACAPIIATLHGNEATIEGKSCASTGDGFSYAITSGALRRGATGEDLEGDTIVKGFSGTYSYTVRFAGDDTIGPFSCDVTENIAATRI
jgi:hypothetical protein